MLCKKSLKNVLVSIFYKNLIQSVNIAIKYICLLCFIMFGISSQSQNQKWVDSLQLIIRSTKNDSVKAKAQLTLAERLVYKDPRMAKLYIDEASLIYKKKPFVRGYASLYGVKANYFYTQSAYDSCMVYLEKSGNEFMKIGDTLLGATIKSNLALTVKVLTRDYDRVEELIDEIEPIARKYKDTSLLATAIENRGIIALNRGYRNIALKHMKETIELREQAFDSVLLPQAYYTIGNLYQDMYQNKEAVNQLDIGIKIADAIGQNNQKAQLLRMKSMSQIKLSQLDKALESALKSLELSKKINLKSNILSTLIQLAEIEINRENYKEAKAYLDEVERTDGQQKNIGIVYNYNIMRGLLNTEINNYTEAIANFDYCISEAEKNNSYRNLKRTKLFKSKVLNKMGKYDLAYDLLKESINASDSINSYLRTSLAEEQKVIFETNRKEKEIALQKSEIELLKEQEKVAESRFQLLVMGLISLLVLGGLLFYAIRQKMKRNRLERQKLDSDLEFKEKQLTTHALHLAHKNEVLLDLKEQLKSIKSESNNTRGFQSIINNINLDINNDNNWEQFKSYFEDVHKDFNTKIMRNYPEVSNNDLRLMSLLKMNLSSKEIANILNISVEGVKKARYRLRKKLNLSTEESLQELVISL
ncbi:hypothetical protein SAMN05444148_1814 [Winogradskyella jejuensis]|uniref:HTH luxR-type domain-containing protein n=2 Tax=Winogradskyella jejuensis TaxID=1089305 RepID=A0A1M5SAD3_9FLAO|nr:hypothetical protein SAMN05444148_1814 [Winogradskyella jejuensis]